MITDLELAREIDALTKRRDQLTQLAALRAEVAALEQRNVPELFRRLVAATAELRGQLSAEIFSRCRERPIAESRFLIYHIAHGLGASDSETARVLQVHREAVAHGRRRAAELLAVDARFAAQVDAVMAALQQPATSNPQPATRP